MRSTPTTAGTARRPRLLAVLLLALGLLATAAHPDRTDDQTLARDPVGDASAYGAEPKAARIATNDPGTDVVQVRLHPIDEHRAEVRIRFADLSGPDRPAGPASAATDAATPDPARQSASASSTSTSVVVRTRVVGCQVTLIGQLGQSTGRMRLCNEVVDVVTYTAGNHDEFVFEVDHRFLTPRMRAHLERPRAIAQGLWARAVTQTGSLPDQLDQLDHLTTEDVHVDQVPCDGWCIVDEAEDTDARFRL